MVVLYWRCSRAAPFRSVGSVGEHRCVTIAVSSGRLAAVCGHGIWECIPLENMRLLLEDHGHITALADGAAEVKGTVEPMSEIHTGTVFVCIHSSFLHR